MNKKEQMPMQELSLENRVFTNTRMMVDAYLNMLVRSLIEKDLTSGSVGLKINVDIRKQITDDGEILYIPEIEPKVSIKVGASGSDKCLVPKGLILRRSHDGKNYVCDNQVSMEEATEQKGA